MRPMVSNVLAQLLILLGLQGLCFTMVEAET